MRSLPSSSLPLGRERWSLAGVLGNRAVAAGLCALVSAAVFLPVLDASFVWWDDPWLVSENPRLGGLTWAALRDVLLNRSPSSSWYTPLAGLRYNAVRHLGGLDPRAFHAANLLLHALDAALVVWLVRALLRSCPRGEPSALTDVRDNLAASAAALLWALHPLRAEVVGSVAAGPYDQALLFMLLSMLAHLEAAGAAGRRRSAFRALSALAYLASALSQPMALGLAGVILAFDGWVLARGERRVDERGVTRLLRGAAPHLAVGAAVLVLNVVLHLQSPLGGHRPVSLAAFGLAPRLAQASYLLAYYAWRPFVPVGLSPVYTQLLEFDPWSPPFVGSALAVVAFMVAAWRLRRRWPGAWALALSYVFLLAPVLGWTDHPYYPNDRYSTAASLVGSIALAFLLSAVRPARRGIAAASLTGVVALGLAAFTVGQCATWKDSEALFRHMIVTLGDHPVRAEIHWRLGLELERQRRLPQAAEHYVRALAIKPQHPVASRGLLRVCLDDRRRSRQEGMACYQQALRVGPEALAARWGSDPTLGTCAPQRSGDGCEPDGAARRPPQQEGRDPRAEPSGDPGL